MNTQTVETHDFMRIYGVNFKSMRVLFNIDYKSDIHNNLTYIDLVT